MKKGNYVRPPMDRKQWSTDASRNTLKGSLSEILLTVLGWIGVTILFLLYAGQTLFCC